MMSAALPLYVGSIVIFLSGVAHLAATTPVVKEFGALSGDNRRIITMEWLGGALTLCFIGILVYMVTALPGSLSPAHSVIYMASSILLFVMGGVGLATGARTSILPMKICPIVKIVVAVLFLLGSVL
jgi:hypothetical protein